MITQPLALCDSCKSVQYRKDMTDVQPCDVCGTGGATPIDAREPTGFFTDFQPEDYTGIFEWTPRSTLPTLTWGVNEGGGNYIGNCDVLSFSDDILPPSTTITAGGLHFRQQRSPGIRKARALTQSSLGQAAPYPFRELVAQ